MPKRLAATTFSAVLVVGAVGIALASGGHSGFPAPSTHSGKPSVIATSASPSPSTTTASPSTTTTTAPASPAEGAPTLSLNLPASLAKAIVNEVGFTVTNPSVAKTVTVTLDLGVPSTATPTRGKPLEQATVERPDPGSRSWVAVPVTVSEAGHDVATYQLDLAAHTAVTARLRVTPVGNVNAVIAVRLSGGGFADVSQSAIVPMVAPSVTGTGPTAVTRGSTSGEFDFTMANTTSGDYTGVRLYLAAYASTPACSVAVFTTAQWSDGGAWKTVSVSTLWPLLDTVALGHGRSTVIRVRVAVPPALDSCVDKGQVVVLAETVGGSSSLNADNSLTPTFVARGESPFFQIK
jgi:hypothetical protein